MINKAKRSKSTTYTGVLIESPAAIAVIAILGICIGLFFIFGQGGNEPILRDQADAYVGEFERYETGKNERLIHFQDGSFHPVYPHTETRDFRNTMESLDKGTTLYVLINPNNGYVAEIKTDAEELLNFESSQEAIDRYDNGYIVLGSLLCATGLFLIAYVIGAAVYKRKEDMRHASKHANGVRNPANSGALRYAKAATKSRVLLETKVEGYAICYRRVRLVNELVVNGCVYDEKKGLIELEHRLCATIDGHAIEAGLDGDSYSYILFDGNPIERKKRIL